MLIGSRPSGHWMLPSATKSLSSSGAQKPISAIAISTGPGEVLVELGDRDVGRRDAGALPQHPPDVAVVGGREVGLVERADAVAVLEAVGGGDDGDAGPAQVAGPLGRRHDDRRGAVVLRAAVVEVERLGDPARRVVLLARQRRAVADRPRVALGVGVATPRATSASASWVTPWSCMKRIVCIAVVWAGVSIPYGAV